MKRKTFFKLIIGALFGTPLLARVNKEEPLATEKPAEITADAYWWSKRPAPYYRHPTFPITYLQIDKGRMEGIIKDAEGYILRYTHAQMYFKAPLEVLGIPWAEGAG